MKSGTYFFLFFLDDITLSAKKSISKIINSLKECSFRCEWKIIMDQQEDWTDQDKR